MAKILMVSSEAAPFAKTGGLADVLGSLPKALVQAGEEIAVLLPFYRRAAVPDAQPVYDRLRLTMGPHSYSANILESVAQGVRFLFVQIPELYDRDSLYGYADDPLRFAALCHAALGVARHLFLPDVIHCHDWQTGLVPLLIKDSYTNHPAYLGIKTVFTIHNLGYQGQFGRNVLADLGLPSRLFAPDLLEFYGDISLLKAGLVFSDLLSTVSPRYAEEIQTPAFGFGLDGLLRARRSSLVGILNGADLQTWNPANDPHIPKTFSADHLAGKQICKRALLAEASLPADREDKPLIGIISRFASQKGFDLMMEIPHELAALDASFVVLGSGEQRYEDFFRWFASAYPNQVSVRIGYDDGLSHRIEAGSDLFLMPSRYEPCGLNQIYSMRYGTLPVVHATGGLDDTVDDTTGFKFTEDNSAGLLESVRTALAQFGTTRWREMIAAAMKRDFSWQASASEYVRLYRNLLPNV